MIRGRYRTERRGPCGDRDGGRASFGSCQSSTTSRTSSPPPKNPPRSFPNDAAVDTQTHTPRHNRTQGAAASAVDTRTHTLFPPSSSPSAPSATPSSPTSSVFGRTHLVTTRWACSSSRRRRRRAEGQRTTMIRGKLFLLLLVTGLAGAVHADYKQSLKNRKLMTEEPKPVGSHAVRAALFLPFDENFDSASFTDELALLLDLPVDRVRITQNFEQGPGTRTLGMIIIDLTAGQETEVSAFFDDNVQFTLPSFGTVTSVDSMEREVAKPNDIATLLVQFVCTSVSATNFPEADYEAAFDNALAQVATVNTSIPFGIQGNSEFCDDAAPPNSTRIVTQIEVPAADLGAVLDLLPISSLLPTNSSTIDLGGDFGVVSLGNDVTLSPYW